MNAYRKAVLALACLSAVPTAAAQWEMTSGLAMQREVHRGTKEVRYCNGPGGSISVGTATPAGNNTNMLAERLNSLSGLSFRYEYDTAGLPEQAAQVVEFRDGTGFAVVGSIDPQSPSILASRFIITKIDCGGIPLWRYFYGDTTEYNTGFDILQTSSGTPAALTFPGDLVAVGKYYKPATATTAAVYRTRIVRTNVAGMQTWDNDYQASLPGDFELQAIAELAPVAPRTTGNLVAVGRIGSETAVMEVDGDNGSVVCTVRTRGLGVAQYHDVVAVKTAAGTSEYLAIGETSAAGTAKQIYLSRFLPNCLLRVHTHWGATADSEIGWATDLTLPTTYAGAPPGVMVVGGEVNGNIPSGFSQDAFMHLAHPQTLMPYVLPSGLPVIGKRYGTQGALAEKALTLSSANNGAYFAGSSSTNWWGNGDLLHALTVRADATAFKTSCAIDWKTPAFNLPLGSGTFGVARTPKFSGGLQLPTKKYIDAQRPCCQ